MHSLMAYAATPFTAAFPAKKRTRASCPRPYCALGKEAGGTCQKQVPSPGRCPQNVDAVPRRLACSLSDRPYHLATALVIRPFLQSCTRAALDRR
jgi:hypothetical protein